MISKEKSRLQISITHEAVELLQLVAISSQTTKSEIVEDMIIRNGCNTRYYSAREVEAIIKRLHSSIMSAINGECFRPKEYIECNGDCEACERRTITDIFDNFLKDY